MVSIHLDGSEANVFYSGQTITGHVRVEANEETKMRGIRLEVTGDARVQWTEDDGKNRRSYSDQENFIDLKMYLTGSGRNDSEITLQPGVHTLPLSFLLPDTVPSSFEGIHGNIRYKVKAVVDRPWKIDNSTEILINVVRLFDLNNELRLRNPIVMRGESPMVGICYHCCCIKGLPEMELTINKGGFVPGETIIISGQVVNISNTTINKITIDFIQEIQFSATWHVQSSHSTQHNKILDSIKRPQIERGCSDTFNDVTFAVPLVVESRLEGCRIISINYCIQVKVSFLICCGDLTTRRDIVIGHVPLQGDGQYGGPIATQPALYASPFQPGTAISEYPSSAGHTGVQDPGWNQGYVAPVEDYEN